MWLSNMLLTEVGWADGFAMPIANAENKALEQEIQRKEKESITWRYRLHEAEDVLAAMGEQLRRCEQALAHTAALCRARKRQPELDVHFRALAEREAGHLQQEMAALLKERRGLEDSRGAQEGEIGKASRRLEELAAQLSWDQHRLEAWLDEADRRHRDTMAVLHYARQDESRVKILSAAIEKKALLSVMRRKALDKEVAETAAAQMQLDGMADTFRQAHTDRHELILQWEKAVSQMQQRDGELQQSALQLAQLRQQIRVKRQALEDKAAAKEDMTRRCHEVTKQILNTNNEADRRKGEYTALEQRRVDLDNELKCLKNTLYRNNLDIEKLRQKIANQNLAVRVKTEQWQEARRTGLALVEQLSRAKHTAVSAEDRAQELDNLRQDEEDIMKELDVVLAEHKEVMFRENQALTLLKTKERDLSAKLIGGTSAFLGLDTSLGKLDQTFYGQEVAIYNQNYEIELLELKISRMKADVNTEDKERFEAQIAELEVELEGRTKTSKALKAELQQQVDDQIRVRRVTERVQLQKRDEEAKVVEVQLQNNLVNRELDALRHRKHEAMVEEKILRLGLRRQRDLLYGHGEEIVSQEKRRQRMAAVVRQAEKEIRAQQDALARQIKIGEQQRQGAAIRLHETTPRIDIACKRYEILICPMPAPDGEESKAYFFQRAEEAKAELRQRLEALWSEVRTKEIENGAFENLVRLALEHNETYRRAFAKASEESSAEYQNKLKLEDQLRAAEEAARRKRAEVRRLEASVEELGESLRGALEAEARAQDEHVRRAEADVAQLVRDVASQREKLFRVTKQYSSATREVRLASRTREETFAEKDIRLGEWREFGLKLHAALRAVAEDNPEIGPLLEALLPAAPTRGAGIRRNHNNKTGGSQRSSSAAASTRPQPASSAGSGAPQRSLVMTPTSGSTVDLGLGLSVTPLTTSSASRDSTSSSGASSSGDGGSGKKGGRSSKAQRRGRG